MGNQTPATPAEVVLAGLVFGVGGWYQFYVSGWSLSTRELLRAFVRRNRRDGWDPNDVTDSARMLRRAYLGIMFFLIGVLVVALGIVRICRGVPFLG